MAGWVAGWKGGDFLVGLMIDGAAASGDHAVLILVDFEVRAFANIISGFTIAREHQNFRTMKMLFHQICTTYVLFPPPEVKLTLEKGLLNRTVHVAYTHKMLIVKLGWKHVFYSQKCGCQVFSPCLSHARLHLFQADPDITITYTSHSFHYVQQLYHTLHLLKEGGQRRRQRRPS